MTQTFDVHPAAAIFPMLSADEMRELAADIKANGLRHPIVVKDGKLIDGRNRLEACKLAEVEPTFVELNGADPVAYIISTNVQRRHMTKGQRAMAVAMIYPEGERGGRGKVSAANREVSSQFSVRLVQQGRMVLRWAPELADAVLAGGQFLDQAYETAQRRKNEAAGTVLRLDALRATDPDLADAVKEERIQLADAEGAARSRRDRERLIRQGIKESLQDFDRAFGLFGSDANREGLARICREHPNELSEAHVIDVLDRVEAVIGQMRDTFNRIGGEDGQGNS